MLNDADREAIAAMTQYGRRITKFIEAFKFREALNEAMNVVGIARLCPTSGTMNLFNQDFGGGQTFDLFSRMSPKQDIGGLEPATIRG